MNRVVVHDFRSGANDPTPTWKQIAVAGVAFMSFFGMVVTVILCLNGVIELPRSGKPMGEVWWTQMDCPERVQAPCLSPSVSIREVPQWAGGWAPNP